MAVVTFAQCFLLPFGYCLCGIQASDLGSKAGAAPQSTKSCADKKKHFDLL